MLTDRGKVSEGSSACFFMAHNGPLHTPDVTSDILENITRDTVTSLASDYEIRPIVSVDRLAIGRGRLGSVTGALQEAYFGIAEARLPEHPEWRTPIYATGKFAPTFTAR